MASTDMKIPMIDLDAPLDSIEDLPSFSAWPTCATRSTITFEDNKKIGDNNHYIEAKITCVEMLQDTENNIEYPAPKPGDYCTLLFDKTHKVGVSNLKDLLEPFQVKFNTKTISQAMEASKGVEVLIVLSRDHQPAKDDKKARDFMKIKAISII